MFIPWHLVLRDTNIDSESPISCKRLDLHNPVCVGDLITIIACSVAGLGFIFWSIHAIRKMRHDPFDDALREAEQRDTERRRKGKGVDPYLADTGLDRSLLVEQGLVKTPNQPKNAYFGRGHRYAGSGSGLGSGSGSGSSGSAPQGYLAQQHLGRGYVTPVRQSPATRRNLNPLRKRAAAARELAIIRAGGDIASYAPFEEVLHDDDDEEESGRGSQGEERMGTRKGSMKGGKGSSLRRLESVSK